MKRKQYNHTFGQTAMGLIKELESCTFTSSENEHKNY